MLRTSATVHRHHKPVDKRKIATRHKSVITGDKVDPRGCTLIQLHNHNRTEAKSILKHRKPINRPLPRPFPTTNYRAARTMRSPNNEMIVLLKFLECRGVHLHNSRGFLNAMMDGSPWTTTMRKFVSFSTLQFWLLTHGS